MTTEVGVDFVSEHFINYVFANKANSRHVRRIVSWIGMLVLAIENRRDSWNLMNKRQLCYLEGGTKYKIRYSHQVVRNNRMVGGIEIVKMAGHQDGPVVQQFACLRDVEKFYIESLAASKMKIAA